MTMRVSSQSMPRSIFLIHWLGHHPAESSDLDLQMIIFSPLLFRFYVDDEVKSAVKHRAKQAAGCFVDECIRKLIPRLIEKEKRLYDHIIFPLHV